MFAEIARSSGSDLLDEAAMEWTVDAARFTPGGGADEQPKPVTFQFNVRFRISKE
jgi:outer membrane biosynthesis protein TonB